MFDNPLDLSYAMHEINNMSYLQSLHSNYAYAIHINPICTYGIDDKPMVIGICFSCYDIDMLHLHHLSHMPCHDHLASDMHCFGCCPFSPYDVSDIAHEETPIVSSYILGDFDPSNSLHVMPLIQSYTSHARKCVRSRSGTHGKISQHNSTNKISHTSIILQARGLEGSNTRARSYTSQRKQQYLSTDIS